MRKAFCKTLIGGAVALLASHSAWALLPIEHWTQSSGAQVWLVNSPSIPMVDVQINFDAGSRRDPVAQVGLASAAAMMVSKGVKADGKQPALDENAVGEAWADLGASFDAGVNNDALTYSLRSLTDAALLGKAADLAARQIAQPAYNATVWRRARERWNASIKEGNTRPSLDLVAHQVLTSYHVTRKRAAMQGAQASPSTHQRPRDEAWQARAPRQPDLDDGALDF